MYITLPQCYAKVGKAKNRISSIYINTPDSSIKATITDQAEKHPVNERTYHWYSANQVCHSRGEYSGKLLHGMYSSFYPNHFLLAKGQFSYGLKDGCWKRWLPDGSLYEIVHYKNGLLNGTREIYSPNGQLRERIYYRKGVRAGKTTIFSQDGRDSVILYKKGSPVVKRDGRREMGGGSKTRVKKDSLKRDGRSEMGDGGKTDSAKAKSRSIRKWKWRSQNDSTPVSHLPSPISQ
jgi:hypothetical protein